VSNASELNRIGVESERNVVEHRGYFLRPIGKDILAINDVVDAKFLIRNHLAWLNANAVF
jgi:hypothetical protein